MHLESQARSLTAGRGCREGPAGPGPIPHSTLSDAFLEGYVQQFLYTFRYFCTPHDFLHFLLDRISSTLSRYHCMSSWPIGVEFGGTLFCPGRALTGDEVSLGQDSRTEGLWVKEPSREGQLRSLCWGGEEHWKGPYCLLPQESRR